MEELARRFCRQALERQGLRYSQELRQVAVEYARAAERHGRVRREIAETLGLSKATLSRWLEGSVQAALHEVVVVEGDSVAAGAPVLVMPSGVRVEGLSVRELISVLAVLR
jgi:predicted transcriptional regulator